MEVMMHGKPDSTIIYIGATMCCIAIWQFLTGGWFTVACLLTLPHYLESGYMPFDDWTGAYYGLEILLLLITGICLLARWKPAILLTYITLACTYVFTGIWSAIDSRPVEVLSNVPEVTPGLALGKWLLVAPGDGCDTAHINLYVWLAEISLLTLFAVLLTPRLITFFRREDVKARFTTHK